MKVIGITGGVGSGKSEVLRLMEEEYGCTVIKTDDVAKQLCEPGEESYQNVIEAFGEGVLDEDGQIDISWINEDLITFVKDRLGHDQRYAIDPAKITAALGWYPETKFEDGIVKTIEWYLNNQDWVEEVTSGDYQHYYEKMYGKR